MHGQTTPKEANNWKSGHSYRQERPNSPRKLKPSACVIKQRTMYYSCNTITSSTYRSVAQAAISSHVLVARVLHGDALKNHFCAHIQMSPHPAVYRTAHRYIHRPGRPYIDTLLCSYNFVNLLTLTPVFSRFLKFAGSPHE